MAIIFCDTDSELWYTRAQELDLKVIRMPYQVDGQESLCDLGEAGNLEEFYAKMKAGSSASTSGLNTQIYLDIFEPYFAKGEDILYIAFSSKMSGTFNYLDVALKELREKYPNTKYRQFDTMNISMGTGILVYMGAKYCREHNDDVDATMEYLSKIVDKIQVYFIVDDMKYLARGGRISPVKANIGNFLQIKPILTVKDGVIDVQSKQNGSKKAFKYMMEMFKENYQDIDGAPVVLVDALNQTAADECRDIVKEFNPNIDVWRQPVGPVIGCHCGPGTVGMIFTRK